MHVELMSYTPKPEDSIIERYILDRGVPTSFDKAMILRKAACSSPDMLKGILFNFFIADVSGDIPNSLPRHRHCSYTGYREMSKDAVVRITASVDASELLDFFERNLCSQRGIDSSALVYSMLAAAQLACPNLFAGLSSPCPPGQCELEKSGCRELARQWAKRIQKIIRISGEAFTKSKPNYVMTFDFTEALGYPVVLTVRRS